MSAPGYQTILNADIPAIELEGGAGRLRVIAGSFRGRKGPAHTFTPVELYDLQLNKGHHVQLDLPVGQNTAIFVGGSDVAKAIQIRSRFDTPFPLDLLVRKPRFVAERLRQRLRRLKQDPWRDYWTLRQRISAKALAAVGRRHHFEYPLNPRGGQGRLRCR